MSLAHRLHYIDDSALRYRRIKKGEAFQFVDSDGKAISTPELERIQKLVIPPAWQEVRVCCEENGHIQAIGYDAKGRKQYIYHPEWVQINQSHKFDKMIKMGEVLPIIRQTIAGHMRQHELTKDRVVATAVWLLDHTFIRIGNVQYAKQNNSYGLTTLREKHVDVEGSTVSFSFKGKSGIYHDLNVQHPRVAKTIRQCIDLPGYEVFQYLDANGQRQRLDSHDVNEYLQQITGESFSAKDFRTWGGTVMACQTLYEIGDAENSTQLKKNVRAAVKDVAKYLGNTITVCRKYYIHPTVLEKYQAQKLSKHFDKYLNGNAVNTSQLTNEEYAAWTLLQ